MYQDYILLVDSGRPRRGNTAGRYRVSAKNKKQAVELLRNTIGFGKNPGVHHHGRKHPAAKGGCTGSLGRRKPSIRVHTASSQPGSLPAISHRKDFST